LKECMEIDQAGTKKGDGVWTYVGRSQKKLQEREGKYGDERECALCM